MLRNANYSRNGTSTMKLRSSLPTPSNSTGNLPEALASVGNNGPLSSTTKTATKTTTKTTTAADLARKRQVRKDDAIRKKLDQELGRKKASSKKAHGSTRPVQGTVGSLRPSQALTLLDTAMVIDAARIMAVKRADAVLVVDHDSNLVGIMTDKDLAFRVVAEGLDVHNTLISQVMTKNPFCVTTDTNATEALSKMVNGGFRHLPCLNADGDVVGLLDITKCLYEALEKLEKAHKSSKELVDALEGMRSDWTQATNPELRSYVDIMRERMASPDLNTILEEHHEVAEIQAKTSVREACRVMKQFHATASLITEDGRITGIFTSKDIVVRVLAADLMPDTTSVIRVMTPRPDTVKCSTTILDALKMMHSNHYLHLPVVDELGHMAGLVDILQVSLAMLRQMNTIHGPSDSSVWNKFWEASFGKDDTGSDVSASDMRSVMVPASEITMPYSASMVGTGIRIGSVVGGGSSRFGDGPLSPSSSTDEIGSEFVFKFKDGSGQAHRFSSSTRSFKELYDKVVEKMGGGKSVTLSYCDEENDQVLILQDSDIVDAVKMAFRNQWPLIRLSVAASDGNISASKSKFVGSIPGNLDPTLLAGGLGIGLGVGLALIFALMRK